MAVVRPAPGADEPPITKQQYEQCVEELLGTPVQVINFCLGDGRTMLHDTKVGERWGANVPKWPHVIFQRAARNVDQVRPARAAPCKPVGQARRGGQDPGRSAGMPTVCERMLPHYNQPS